MTCLQRRSDFPVVKGKAKSNSLLESDIAGKDRAVESSRLGPRKVSR